MLLLTLTLALPVTALADIVDIKWTGGERSRTSPHCAGKIP